MKNIKNLKKAFTLAEVLITLGIIGVVAAITMPTLIKNYQKQQAVTQLKKAYSTLSNAIQMSKQANGDVADWDIHFDKTLQSASDFADKYLIPYMNVVKACKTDKSGDCSINIKHLNNTDISHNYNNSTSFFTNDGTKVIAGVGYSSNGMITNSYSITVDINGNKAPNTLGKDVFVFQLHINDGVLVENFHSATSTSINGDCKKNGQGYSCAAKIIKAGWKMENDYPW